MIFININTYFKLLLFLILNSTFVSSLSCFQNKLRGTIPKMFRYILDFNNNIPVNTFNEAKKNEFINQYNLETCD